MAIEMHGAQDNDPRRLRELVSRAGSLAAEHAIPSVIVGLVGREGDLLVPELIDYIESALRVEDAIFRLTRERAVLFVSDVDRERATRIVERLLESFRNHFPSSEVLDVHLGYFDVEAGSGGLSLKEILPRVFAGAA